MDRPRGGSEPSDVPGGDVQPNDAPLLAGGRATGGADPGFERSVRRWLRAYPPRWRVARADEVLGTLVELAESGATRLDRRAAVGLLVGGLRTRARTGPLLHQRIGYMVGLRTSPKYLEWMADDLTAPFSTASLLLRIAQFGLYCLPWWIRGDSTRAWLILAVGLVASIGDGIGEHDVRRKRRLRLLLTQPGDPRSGPHWVEGCGPRVRAAGRDVAGATATCLAWCTVIGIAASPRPATWAGAIALVLGLVGAAVATWRWRRWGARGPEQPDRVVLRWRARSAFPVVCFGALAWMFVTDDVFGPFASRALTIIGLVVLPATVAAWVWSLRAPRDVAVSDLAWVAGTGRPPTQDDAVLEAVPVGAPEGARSAGLFDLVRTDPDRPALG